MSVDEGWATCGVCRHAYRPGVQESVDGHLTATGHPPTPGGVPTPPPTGEIEQPTTEELLREALRRVVLQAAELAELRAGLDGLASTWEKASAVDPVDGPGLGRAAEMLRGYLARPPIHAQADEEAHDG